MQRQARTKASKTAKNALFMDKSDKRLFTCGFL
jgi:hypothetical protein